MPARVSAPSARVTEGEGTPARPEGAGRQEGQCGGVGGVGGWEYCGGGRRWRVGVRACSFVQNVKRFIVPTSVICMHHPLVPVRCGRRAPHCASTHLAMSPLSIVSAPPYQAASTVRRVACAARRTTAGVAWRGRSVVISKPGGRRPSARGSASSPLPPPPSGCKQRAAPRGGVKRILRACIACACGCVLPGCV